MCTSAYWACSPQPGASQGMHTYLVKCLWHCECLHKILLLPQCCQCPSALSDCPRLSCLWAVLTELHNQVAKPAQVTASCLDSTTTDAPISVALLTLSPDALRGDSLLISSVCRYDSAAHLIEETKAADTSAGYPMLKAIVLSFAIGLVYLLSLTICIQVRCC